MHRGNKNILTLNGGSSSLKFAVYEPDGSKEAWLTGKIDRIGLPDSLLTWTDNRKKEKDKTSVKTPGMQEAAAFLLHWLEERGDILPLAAVGHRIVHGLTHRDATFIDEELLTELRGISAFDPDHLPGEIELINLINRQDPGLPQVACFDTSFHANLPRIARLLPLPRRYDEEGIRKYGFHGLSYTYILEELTRIAGPVVANGSLILAHLGNGASLAAVKDGNCIDTTMGFTPTGGIVMGTRTGDLDPGVIAYLLQHEHLTPAAFNDLVNHRSGLLGVSDTSSDMQDLLAKESGDIRAAEAVALFCYHAKKSIGSFSAVMGGLETIVFTGGIGEKSSMIRSRICSGLEYLGIRLDPRANENNEIFLSEAGSRVGVYAIPTDEEWMIARTVIRLIGEKDKT